MPPSRGGPARAGASQDAGKLLGILFGGVALLAALAAYLLWEGRRDEAGRLLGEAREALKRGEWARLVDRSQAMIDLDPTRAEAYCLRGAGELKLERVERAVESLSSVRFDRCCADVEGLPVWVLEGLEKRFPSGAAARELMRSALLQLDARGRTAELVRFLKDPFPPNDPVVEELRGKYRDHLRP